MQLLEDDKEYALGMKTEDGNIARFYVRTTKDEVVFETDGFGRFTKEEFNAICQRIGSMKVKVN